MIEVVNADIGYNHALLKNVNFQLHKGSTTMMVGRNGSGKSTLLKTIAGQIPPLKGIIQIDYLQLQLIERSKLPKKIAMVYSKAAANPNLTTTDLVALGFFIHSKYYIKLDKAQKRKIAEIIEMLGLSEYQHYSIVELSDGNLQKAMIGRAIVQDSPMIILDEPTSHLDSFNKEQIFQLLFDISRRQNKLILFSCHDYLQGAKYADQILFLDKGNVQSGLSEDMLHQNIIFTKRKMAFSNEKFRIIAPAEEENLMRQFLKKSAWDFSGWSFTYLDHFWEVQRPYQAAKRANSFLEISTMINSDFNQSK